MLTVLAATMTMVAALHATPTADARLTTVAPTALYVLEVKGSGVCPELLRACIGRARVRVALRGW
jgi:hypothetical protein